MSINANAHCPVGGEVAAIADVIVPYKQFITPKHAHIYDIP